MDFARNIHKFNRLDSQGDLGISKVPTYEYALPYDPLRPLICFDERPCFLIDDVGSILPMSPGKAKRHHYEYAKIHHRTHL